MPDETTESTIFFWNLAESLLAEEGVSKGTMMGYPCLRVNGEFFASAERQTGDLIVKLPAAQVNDLIEGGIGQPFAPAGRRFREWVLIEGRDTEQWRELMVQALTFVAGKA